MKALNELFKIMRLAFSITVHEAQNLTRSAKAKFKQFGMPTVRRLRNWMIFFCLLWLGMCALAFVLKDPHYFAGAGIVILIPLVFLIWTANVLVGLIQVAYMTIGDWEESAAKRTAEKMVGMVRSIFSFFALVSLYGLVFPIHEHPSHVVILAFLGIIFIGYTSTRPHGGGVGMARLLVVVAPILFIMITMSMVMPQSVEAIREMVPQIDAYVAGSVLSDETSSDGVSLDVKPTPGPAVAVAERSNSFLGIGYPFPLDGVQGWRVFRVPSNQFEPVNTFVEVGTGDTIEYQAMGSVSYDFKKFVDRWFRDDEWVSVWATPDIGLDGISQDQVNLDVCGKSRFLIDGNQQYWNLIFAIGTNDAPATDGYQPVKNISDASKAWGTHLVEKAGIIQLVINHPRGWKHTMYYSGEFKVAIRIRSST